MAISTTGLIPNWFPPNRENYDLIVSIWKWMPVGASLQWVISWYGMGKTSVDSRFNLPGRVAWLTMEVPGFLTLLYTMYTLSAQQHPHWGEEEEKEAEGLPYQNKVLAFLFVLHYVYRALLFPFLQPSMSPIHPVIWLNAVAFQVTNGLAIGGWLGAYGPTTAAAWGEGPGSTLRFAAGLVIFYLGLAGNYYHDDELREIRRRAARRARDAARKDGDVTKAASIVHKHYEVPEAGLFKVVLYPHYFCEWVEWFGFWMAAGWGCLPARCFLFNEVTAMLPRAVKGRKWYAERFGEDKIRGRWAVIPGVV